MISLSKEFVQRLVNNNGFKPQSMEKVLRLIILLNEIFSHPYLRDKFVLKGGTALNMFVLDMPRLSVDIDLNYIGSVDRDQMLEERPECERRFQNIFDRLGFLIKRMPSEHAGGKWQLQYISSYGDKDSLEVDLNYMFRVPLSPIQKQNSVAFEHIFAKDIPLLDSHELTAGKLAALFSRTVSRDLFDTYQLFTNMNLNMEILKPLFLVYGAINRKDWRTIQLEDALSFPEDYSQKLVPMLSRGLSDIYRNPDFAIRFFKEIKERLTPLLNYSDSEIQFLELILSKGEIQPHLITEDSILQEKIERHPGLLWKAKNVKTLL
jgi:predicted nucleotidyltransferase component of viral defense system